MPHVGMATPLENVQKPLEIGVAVCVRILDRVAHARLGREVHHEPWLRFFEQRCGRFAFSDIDPMEPEAPTHFEFVEARPLEARIVV